MTDPDRGSVPPQQGASVAERAAGVSPPRDKVKRSGSKAHDAMPSAGVGTSGSPGPDGRSGHHDGDSTPARKRKRRRRNRAAAGASSVAQPQKSDVQLPDKAVSDGTTQPKSGKKRHRARNRRGPQGRPLLPGKTAPGAASAPPVAAVPQPEPSPERRGTPPAGPARSANANSAHGAYGPQDQELYAALDLGTNNCRLLIAQPTRPGQFRVVDAFSRIVRLGEGLAASGRLSQEAMDRAAEALRICAAKLALRDIRRMRLIATEACRQAENGAEFLTRVTSETGLVLEIIDRETEARLAVSGCSSLVGRDARSVVLFDIGGGSSEIAVIRIADSRSSRLANHITHWTSLPVGVVTLSERHGGRDVSPAIFEAMIGEVTLMLEKSDCPPFASGDGEGGSEDFHLIGTSGTVTTLAGVHLDLPRYDRRKVDGLWLSDAEVTAMQAKLLSWDYAGRAANPCIGPDRADLVLAGCAILEAIRRRWPGTRMRVADRGLREGLLTDMMADDGVWRRNRPRRPMRGNER
ncbi:MAG: Ppx/GppA phosphatase family protein [Allorhizobium sp.]